MRTVLLPRLELSGALAWRQGLWLRFGRNLKSPLEMPDRAPSVAHVVCKLDELQAPAPGAQHLDCKNHKRTHAHHVVSDQKSSPRCHLTRERGRTVEYAEGSTSGDRGHRAPITDGAQLPAQGTLAAPQALDEVLARGVACDTNSELEQRDPCRWRYRVFIHGRASKL